MSHGDVRFEKAQWRNSDLEQSGLNCVRYRSQDTVAALLLAVISIGAVRVMETRDAFVKQTYAVCNFNRLAGLALLLVGPYPVGLMAIPEIASYAVLAPLVMLVYVKLYAPRREAALLSATG
jgi:hypothetical protein